jgi:hypothetical protein
LLAPIAEEVGIELFRTIVAYSSSFGTKEDYHAMVSTLGDNFEDSFLAWGKAVSVTGWGTFKMPHYDPLLYSRAVGCRIQLWYLS